MQSVRVSVAQPQSGPVLWRIMRAARGPGERGVQLRRFRRWWSHGSGAASSCVVATGAAAETEESTATGLSRWRLRTVARGEREGSVSVAGFC